MNLLFKSLIFLALMSLSTTACSEQTALSQPQEHAISALPNAVISVTGVTYEALLNKSLSDQTVADFIAENNCSSVEQLQFCRSAGVVLWIDTDQKVQGIFLYPGNNDGFDAYQGQLPFGLTFSDTMEIVEHKLGRPREIHAPQAGWLPGLPDEGIAPDHIHYQAIYKRFGMTIIYNSPSANDKGATIHALLINSNCSIC
jgi:hypothetical protein